MSQTAIDPAVIDTAVRVARNVIGPYAPVQGAAILREISARSLALAHQLDPAWGQRRLAVGLAVAAGILLLMRR